MKISQHPFSVLNEFPLNLHDDFPFRLLQETDTDLLVLSESGHFRKRYKTWEWWLTTLKSPRLTPAHCFGISSSASAPVQIIGFSHVKAPFFFKKYPLSLFLRQLSSADGLSPFSQSILHFFFVDELLQIHLPSPFIKVDHFHWFWKFCKQWIVSYQKLCTTIYPFNNLLVI